MTKDEALKLVRDWIAERPADRLVSAGKMISIIDRALAQPVQERNFCPRCGKRTPDPTTIHTCTPPMENT